jgi:hypothetical protein
MVRRGDPTPGDGFGPDGTVRLRCYLPHADTTWLSLGCGGAHGCHRIAHLGIAEAIRLMGSGDATVGQLARRLRCAACGGRQVYVQIATDPRPPEVREREGPRPETRAMLRRD